MLRSLLDLRGVTCFGVTLVACALSAISTPAADAPESFPDPYRPAAITADHVPVVPPALVDRLRQYQSTRSAAFGGWSPDGNGMLVSTRFGDTAQLHRVYMPGGRREQITFFNEPCSGRFVTANTDGKMLLSMGRGGDENFQIYRLDPKSGLTELLSDGKSRNELGPVSRDGSLLAYNSNRRNLRDTDIYVADPRSPGESKLLLETTSEFWIPVDWSPDGKSLLVNRTVSINETYPAVLSAAGGKPKLLPNPGTAPAAFGPMAYAPDGKTAYIVTDAVSEFAQLASFDFSTGNYEWLTKDIPWSVESLEVHEKSGKVAFTVNEDGGSSLYLLSNGKRTKLDLPLGVVSGIEFSPDAEQLGFTLSLPNLPPDAYSISLADGKLTRWTFSEVGGLNTESFRTATLFRFKSFDGLEVPAYYFKPATATAAKPAAVIINIHGGPEGQYRPGFSPTEQFYLKELGIAVIHPNVRGSDGYGKSYLKMDNGPKREDSVRDIGALLDWIATQPELDKNRVAVVGGSYGGYMVLASLVHFGERIKLGVDIVGIASFVTFLKNTSPYRQDLRRVEYGDERDPEMLKVFEKIDPMNSAEKITSALMVVHGRNDPRVPFSEAEQIAAKVRSTGRKVWTVYADNEGHGFAKKLNRDYMSAAMVLFFQDQLLK